MERTGSRTSLSPEEAVAATEAAMVAARTADSAATAARDEGEEELLLEGGGGKGSPSGGRTRKRRSGDRAKDARQDVHKKPARKKNQKEAKKTASPASMTREEAMAVVEAAKAAAQTATAEAAAAKEEEEAEERRLLEGGSGSDGGGGGKGSVSGGGGGSWSHVPPPPVRVSSSSDWAEDSRQDMHTYFKRTPQQKIQRRIERAVICVLLLVCYVYHVVFKPHKSHINLFISAYRSLDPMAWGGSTIIQFGLLVIEISGQYIDPVIAMILDFSWAILIFASGIGDFMKMSNVLIIISVIVGTIALAFMGVQDIFDYKRDKRMQNQRSPSTGPSHVRESTTSRVS